MLGTPACPPVRRTGKADRVRKARQIESDVPGVSLSLHIDGGDVSQFIIAETGILAG